MNYIQECFEEHGKVLINLLKHAGFSNNQILSFLGEAASCIATSNQHKSHTKIISNFVLLDSSDLLSEQNISKIANKVNIESGQVISGLKIILPLFLKSYLRHIK